MAYLTFTTLVFAAALILVEAADSTDDDLTTRPISHYFSTGTAVVQDVMFALMAFALWYTTSKLGLSWMGISLAVVGLGLVGAMSTDTWPKAFFGFDRQLHYTSAGTCFIAGLSMMLADDSRLFAIAYALVALLLYMIDRTHTAVQEKIGVLMLIVWVFGYSLGMS